MNNITVYGIKSERKNAKCNTISYNTFNKSQGLDKAKIHYTEIDYMDLKQWLQNNEYSRFKVVAYYGNENICNWNTSTFYSIESVLKRVALLMSMINKLNGDGDEIKGVYGLSGYNESGVYKY